jgi:hypothetical protein
MSDNGDDYVDDVSGDSLDDDFDTDLGDDTGDALGDDLDDDFGEGLDDGYGDDLGGDDTEIAETDVTVSDAELPSETSTENESDSRYESELDADLPEAPELDTDPSGEGSEAAQEQGTEQEAQSAGQEQATGAEGDAPPGNSRYDRHVVPATLFEQMDTVIDETYAERIAEHEYPNKGLDVPDTQLKGVAYEGMTLRALRDTTGDDDVHEDGLSSEHIQAHPENVTLRDGRPAEPDFALTNDQGDPVQIVDAKGYTRKETSNPEASASSLTHMDNLGEASKYTEIDDDTVESVTFVAPAETAHMEAVQEAVSDLGTEERPVSIEAVGTEAELKQRMEDLRVDPSERYGLSDDTLTEIDRIEELPAEDQASARADLVESLQDERGDETAQGRNLRWNASIGRNGESVTVTDDDGT